MKSILFLGERLKTTLDKAFLRLGIINVPTAELQPIRLTTYTQKVRGGRI